MHPITKQPQQEQEREQCHEASYEPLTPDATQLKTGADVTELQADDEHTLVTNASAY